MYQCIVTLEDIKKEGQIHSKSLFSFMCIHFNIYNSKDKNKFGGGLLCFDKKVIKKLFCLTEIINFKISSSLFTHALPQS